MASSISLLLSFTMLCFCSVFPTLASSHKLPSSVLSLKARKIPSGPGPTRHPSRLPFHHNVSLIVAFSVGSPPQPVSMVLDTGSELSWLHCKKSPTVNSVFDPTRSKSYSPIPCNSPVCTTRTRDLSIPGKCDPKTKLCHVIVAYADASSMEGSLASDNFQLGSSSSPVPGFLFGCMDSGVDTSAAEDSNTTGLLGMNRGSLSFVTQTGYPKFAYCISGQDESGVLLLGESSLPWLKPLNYTPLVQMSVPLPYFDRTAYTVRLEGIKVGSVTLSIPRSVLLPDHTGAGQTMVDSGTQFTFLLGDAYGPLKKEFLAQTKGVLRVFEDPNFVFQGAMDLCYRVPLAQTRLPALPSVTLMFEGAEMSVTSERLLYRVPGEVRGSDAIHCLTFGNSDLLGVESYIIGHHHQQNMWMEFDLVNSRVGLAEVRCDMASKRLGVGP